MGGVVFGGTLAGGRIRVGVWDPPDISDAPRVDSSVSSGSLVSVEISALDVPFRLCHK